MDTSSARAPTFSPTKAAQVKLGDKGFLSRDITVPDLLLNRSDVHHVYPKTILRAGPLSAGRYNQIANFVLAQSEINIAIGDNAPEIVLSPSWRDSVAAEPRVRWDHRCRPNCVPTCA